MSQVPNPVNLIAATSFGLEAVVARELKQLGHADPRSDNGRVEFAGTERDIGRANLWLRSAERVLIKVGEFPASDFGELFERTKSLDWTRWLTPQAEFPVRGRSVRSQLHSVPDCQRLVKKAIVESLRAGYKVQELPETGPLYTVEVSLLNDVATLTLDTTGPGLHKRGYRTKQGLAPLKETLAAGLIQLSYWNASRPFLDPFCGSGTIPIEAALIGRNQAPGLNRSFAAEAWPQIAVEDWKSVREEARDLLRPQPEQPIIGTDHDFRVLRLAREHAVAAGVSDCIHFQELEFSELKNSRKYGCLISNPPYGERSGDKSGVEDLYRQMGQVFAPLDTWSIYILTSHPTFEKLLGRKAERKRKLYNGRIECTYYQFPGPPPPRRPRPDESGPTETQSNESGE